MIRVFVGTSANGEDAESCAVLEWSIRKHTSAPVEITWMRLSRDANSIWGGWDTTRWATPFSAFRWAIPEACEFKGRAIYSDSDVIFLSDLSQLWQQSFAPGHIVMGKGGASWRLCVSMWDCEAAKGRVMPVSEMKRIPTAHTMMTQKMVKENWCQPFSGDWNCLDGEGHKSLLDGDLKALHYTDMSSQPHLKYAQTRLAAEGRKHWFNGTVRPHPRADVQRLFDDLYEEARANGYVAESYIPNEMFGSYQKADLSHYRGR